MNAGVYPEPVVHHPAWLVAADGHLVAGVELDEAAQVGWIVHGRDQCVGVARVDAPRLGGLLRVVVHAGVGEHDEPGRVDVEEVPARPGVAGSEVLGYRTEPGPVGVAQAADLPGRSDARRTVQPPGQAPHGPVPHGFPRTAKQLRGQFTALGGQSVQQPDDPLPPGVVALLDPLDGGVEELAEPPLEPQAEAGLQCRVQLGAN